jgi:hypothetical protein
LEEHQIHAGLSLERLHTVPTHLTMVDTVLSLGEFSLSSRQFLLLLVGGSLSAALWTRTTVLVVWLPPFGVALHLTLLFLLAACILLLTFGQAQGRSLDSWLIVVAAYLARPHLYLWSSLRQHPSWPLPSGAWSVAVQHPHRGEGEEQEEPAA